jgi:transcription termination/antitermination protein NusG
VSDEPNKMAEEELATSHAASAGENGTATPQVEAKPQAEVESQADAEGPDNSEVVPVEQKPLSRPALHGSEEEKAKKKAEEGPIEMDWYILKVQSNRERSIADALKRKIAIEGLDKYVGEIVVPTEKVTEFKAGKKKIVERKLYPGYIVVHMAINDDTWFAVRETSGIGDFTGAGGKPSPMLAHEVARIVQTEEEESDESPKLDIKFKTGDRVKVKDGTFEGFEGEVGTIDAQSGKVQVMINIFGRSTPVELEYWQVENI